MNRIGLYRIIWLSLGGLMTVPVAAQQPHGPTFTMACNVCHSPDGWNVNETALSFNHDSATSFALDGGHNGLKCLDCHAELVFEDTENNCIDCHIDVHESTVGNDCIRCHETDNWLVFSIPELHEQEGVSLLGAHALAACQDCHTAPNLLAFEPMGNDCYSCHDQDYMTTEQPDHTQVGFTTDCAQCHDAFNTEWSAGLGFHNLFPLTGPHDISDCATCHPNDFVSASGECISCHLDDYQSTTLPDHQLNNLNNDCTKCHDRNAMDWSLPDYHDFYPLEGVHDVQCIECHTDGTYRHISSACFSCHQDDYDATTNPDHASAGIGTDCDDCHTLTPGWLPATYTQHDNQQFPIYSGNHSGEWNTCFDCHTTGVYAQFSCIDCHEHDDPSELADDHDDVSGYVYESAACLACHPDGED